MPEWFIQWWQHLPQHVNPVMVELGPLKIRWYGFMYLVVLGITYILARYRLRKESLNLSLETLDKAVFWGMVGVLVGARLGYVFFYNFTYYIQHPLEIILPFQLYPHFRFVGYGGMSYHGGLICFILVIFFIERRERLPVFTLTDFFGTVFPLGYTFGRLGNFINGELYGRVTQGWWGMYFPNDPSGRLRHPSQLYEAFLEGVVLFIFMWTLRKRSPFAGFHTALYLMGYGTARFVVEFARQPDPQLGLLWLGASMGQILCSVMILCGALLLLVKAVKK